MCKGPPESFVVGRKLRSNRRDIAADMKDAPKLQGELACLLLCMLIARGLLVSNEFATLDNVPSLLTVNGPR